MRKNYYFLGALLPELRIDETPELGLVEFDELLRDNLAPKDYAQVQTLRAYYDIFNLLAYWKKGPFNFLGNLDESLLEEALITKSLLPSYVFEFLERYPEHTQKVVHFPILLANFFYHEFQHASGFLKAYLKMEKEVRLVLAALRAKRLQREVPVELFLEDSGDLEDSSDLFVAEILAQKDAPSYDPPEEYAELRLLFQRHYMDPIELEKTLSAYRFDKIEEMLGGELFSIDRILGYMAKLLIIEKKRPAP